MLIFWIWNMWRKASLCKPWGNILEIWKVSKALGEGWFSVTLPNFDIKDAAQFPKWHKVRAYESTAKCFKCCKMYCQNYTCIYIAKLFNKLLGSYAHSPLVFFFPGMMQCLSFCVIFLSVLLLSPIPGSAWPFSLLSFFIFACGYFSLSLSFHLSSVLYVTFTSLFSS